VRVRVGASIALAVLLTSCVAADEMTLVESRDAVGAGSGAGSRLDDLSYDEFISWAADDIARYWDGIYPDTYGGDYVELMGGVHADFPDNPNELPSGCDYEGNYAFVEDNAFYCDEGDFIVYDDARLFPEFADAFGVLVTGVILAHEWGHAIQSVHRHDILDRYSSTTIELQADCFAGAWIGDVKSSGRAPFTVGDNDITGALLGLVQIGDAPGDSAYDPAAHGSAFDRVSAFQDGFTGGPQPCIDYETDEPLPLQFGFTIEELSRPNPGDFPFGDEMFTQLGDDLTLYWSAQLAGADWTPPTLRVDDVPGGEPDCSAPIRVVEGVWFCAPDAVVVIDRSTAERYYNKVPGDFAVGYLMGLGFSEAVQQALDTDLTGDGRALMNDCLVGTWARDILPFNQNPIVVPSEATPRVSLSPGDLDEAIRTALDLGSSYFSLGSPFDKVDSFRRGVLEGIDTCFA
jgi:predicted metalloprotease